MIKAWNYGAAPGGAPPHRALRPPRDQAAPGSGRPPCPAVRTIRHDSLIYAASGPA